jgi:uncharacterized membrane protein YfcA
LDPLTLTALLSAGLAMGAVNNLAGAAGLLGLLALETAAGLDPLHANASLRLSAVALGVSGWLGFASGAVAVPRRAWLYGAMTVPGAVGGAVLAVTMPVWVYRTALLAVVLVVLAQQLRPSTAVARHRPWTGPLLFLLLGVHMGFLQVGTGLLAIAALSSQHSRDLVEVNAAKMAVVLCAATASTLVLSGAGTVAWGPAAVLAAGNGIGSFAASRWSIARGHAAVRAAVVAISVAVLVRLVWQTV